MAHRNNLQIPDVFVIQNPVAGKSNPDQVRAEIENHLTASGNQYRIYETTGDEDIREIVKDALNQGYGTIWAAGGDGTVSAVANGLVEKEIPMGIIPIGTGNALARELDIPLNVNAACDILTGPHQTRELDVLQIEDNYFVLAVSVGLSAFTMAKTARQQKRRLGRLAYLLNGMRIIVSNSIWPFKISIDGQPLVIRASEVIAANAGIIGYKPLRWGTQVRPDDGRVDLCRVRVESARDLFSVLSGVVFNQQDRLEELSCNSAHSTIEIDSRKRIPVEGDGEFIGYTPVKIKIIPGSLKVIVPGS